MAIVRGEQARRTRDHEDARIRNHELARLVAYAFHEPAKMPDYKTNDEPAKKGSAVDNERVRGYFIGLALRSKT